MFTLSILMLLQYQLAVKKENKFTMHFRHVTELGGYDAHPIMTDLAYQIFR